jgi:uncharacterized protein
VDFILDSGESLVAIEVKSGATFHPDYSQSLIEFASIAQGALKSSTLVYGGSEAFSYKETRVVPWNGS